MNQPNQEPGIRESIRKHEARIAHVEWQIRFMLFWIAVGAVVTLAIGILAKLSK